EVNVDMRIHVHDERADAAPGELRLEFVRSCRLAHATLLADDGDRAAHVRAEAPPTRWCRRRATSRASARRGAPSVPFRRSPVGWTGTRRGATSRPQDRRA